MRWVLAAAAVRAALLRAAPQDPGNAAEQHAPTPSAVAHGRGSEPAKGSALRRSGGAHAEAAVANATAPAPAISADEGVLGPPVKIQCPQGVVLFPADMILISGKALWCPNAKVATTTLYDMFLRRKGLTPGQRCDGFPSKCPALFVRNGIETVSQVPPARHHELCSAFSFTFVRNPWDRVRSAYQDKILQSTRQAAVARAGPLGTANFAGFVRHVAQSPTADIHWTPFDTRCATNTFDYSFIGKLEDNFDAAIKRVFQASGLALQTPHSLVNGTTDHEEVDQAEVVRELQDMDARDSHREPKPFEVPHKQDSKYESGIKERYAAYLDGPGMKYKTELVDLVGKTYGMDIWPYGYSFAH